MKIKEKKTKTIKISIVASLLLSIAFIILILKFTINPNDLQDIFKHDIRYEFFLIAVILNVFSWFLWGVRLKVLSGAIDKDVHISVWEGTKIVIANLFLAGITPSMAGGEPVRIHLLHKDGMNVGGATAVVLGERLIDAIFILTIVPLALYVLKSRISNGAVSLGLSIGVVVFIAGVILFLYSIKYPEKIRSFLIFISDKIGRFSKKREAGKRAGIVKKIKREVDNFHNSMVFFLSEGRKSFLLAGILTVIMWSIAFMIPSMLLLGLGLYPFFIESYAAQVLLLVIIMMPTTPGSAGVAEVGVGALYVTLIPASPSYLLGVFVLLFRFITYHMNLIVGAIFQYRIFKSVASFSLDTIKKQK